MGVAVHTPLCPLFSTFLVLSIMAAMPPSPPISHVISLPFDPPTGATHPSTNWHRAWRQWLRFRWVSFIGFRYDQSRWSSTTACRCYHQSISGGFGHPWNPSQTHNATCTLHCKFLPPLRRAGVWQNFFMCEKPIELTMSHSYCIILNGYYVVLMLVGSRVPQFSCQKIQDHTKLLQTMSLQCTTVLMQ